MKTIDEQVIEFICNREGCKKEDLLESTYVIQKLGLAGLDGFEFVEDYAEKFSVDISKFPSIEYFGDETPFCPIQIIPLVIRFVLKILPKQKKLLVSDLIKGAKTGFLIDKYSKD